jgi:hypothetical protein
MRTAAAILGAATLAAVKAVVVVGVFAGVLTWSAPAKVNEIDLSAWTCKQFQSASKDQVTLILAWLNWAAMPKSLATIALRIRIPS